LSFEGGPTVYFVFEVFVTSAKAKTVFDFFTFVNSYMMLPYFDGLLAIPANRVTALHYFHFNSETGQLSTSACEIIKKRATK